jgi:predicted HTH transcriptional regulator
MFNLKDLNKYREGNRLEAKKAVGGLPNSLWETYSAFANTNGGVILLGVEQALDGALVAVGLNNPEKLIKEFWDIINNKNKVNVNILFDRYVRIEQINDKSVIVIEVPRADRAFKPIYLNNNLLPEHIEETARVIIIAPRK